MTMALQTQADWGAIERSHRGERIERQDAMHVQHDRVAAWLIKAALRHVGRAVPVSTEGSLAVLYPIEFARPLAILVARAEGLALRYQRPGEQLVDIGAGS